MSEEKKVLEFGGNRYQVSEQFLDAFNTVKDQLTEGGIPAEAASSQAWTMVQTMITSGLMKKSEAPKEVVPDLAEIASPFVEKALETNDQLKAGIASYLGTLADYKSALETAGLDAGYELATSGAQTFIRLQRQHAEGIVLEAKVNKGTPLSDAALAVPDAHRLAVASVMAVVNAAAKKKEVDTSKVKIAISVEEDGSVSLSNKGKTRKGGGVGGGGKRSTYDYSFEDGEHVITKNGEEWVRSDAETEDDLVAAIKSKCAEDGIHFAKVHWTGSTANKGKSWWPFRDA